MPVAADPVALPDYVLDADGNPLEVKRVKVDLAASGDLIAGVTGRKLRVVYASLFFATAQTLKLQSGGTTDLTGAMTLTALTWPPNRFGWLETAAGEKLNAALGGSVQLSGVIGYVEVP